jgi:retron-type reverse transcriptase
MANKSCFKDVYDNIISVENLLLSWKEFLCGKRSRKDVREFERNLMDNILDLHNDLRTKEYKHSQYEAFNISDPKPRNIHKAKVRDRLLHHALYRTLYPFFDKTFISHSYSCRSGKGLHKALNAFRDFIYKASNNHTKTVWVLKCDIRKFFASIDHAILIKIIKEYIPDKDIQWLISEVINSFYSTSIGIGLPLGNLTSQLLVNIYMNKLDQFIKHKVKAKYYIRYADDFIILSQDKKWLEEIIPVIQDFLRLELCLELHPNKVSIETIASGVDFLGWVHFPDHRVIRATTKRRMFRRIREKRGNINTVQSYLGVLTHGNTNKLTIEVQKLADTVTFDAKQNSPDVSFDD